MRQPLWRSSRFSGASETLGSGSLESLSLEQSTASSSRWPQA